MKILKLLSLLMILQPIVGCEKFVEIAPPQDFMISSTIFKNNETAISATTAIYATMMSSDVRLPYHLSLYMGLYSDELTYNQTLPTLLSLYQYSLLSQDALTNSFWKSGFNYIYQANAVIEGLNKSSSISTDVKNQLLGEALFTRAFWYYYLSLLYGPVPLITTTDYESNASLSRSSEDIIRIQILKDLSEAKSLLTEKYVAGNTISESSDRLRPNKFTASALLARIYLQLKIFDKAEKESSEIISNAKFTLSDLALVFKRTSKEVIWQLELPANTGLNNSYEAAYFPLTAKPTSSSTFLCSSISQDLLTLFSAKDKRRATWIGTYTDPTSTPSITYAFPTKLKSKTAPADEYSTPFRLAETYLIRAEARAQLGQLAESIEDVDKIRSRAGLDLLKIIAPDISQSALLDSINKEKRRELFCEWGIRWSTIRGGSNSNDVMKSIAAKKNVPWKPTAILLPIPLNEILNSANKLKQNEGYN